MESRREFLVMMASAIFAAQEKNAPEFALQIIRVETREAADSVVQRLKAGEAFDALASKLSIDASAPKGGYIGKVKLSALRPEIREALEGVEPGQMTAVVQTPAGYMILKVLSPADASALELSAQPRPVFQPAPFNYQLVTSVIGDAEVESLFRQYSKPPNYEQNLTLVRDLRHGAVNAGIRQLQSQLALPSTGGEITQESGTA